MRPYLGTAVRYLYGCRGVHSVLNQSNTTTQAIPNGRGGENVLNERLSARPWLAGSMYSVPKKKCQSATDTPLWNYTGTTSEYRPVCPLVFDSLLERFTVFFPEKYYCCIELYRANDVLGSISNLLWYFSWHGTVIPFQSKKNIIMLRFCPYNPPYKPGHDTLPSNLHIKIFA
jgi:hypothetical protein